VQHFFRAIPEVVLQGHLLALPRATSYTLDFVKATLGRKTERCDWSNYFVILFADQFRSQATTQTLIQGHPTRDRQVTLFLKKSTPLFGRKINIIYYYRTRDV
jgi:hypothetical protein